MARIGYLTGLLPGSMKNGTEIATARIAEAIQRAGHDLHLIGYKRRGDPPLVQEAFVLDVLTIDQKEASLAENFQWALASLLRNEPISAAKFRSRRAAAAPFQGLDLVLVDKPQMALLFQPFLGFTPVSVVWHAIEWKTYQGVATSASGLKRALYRRESALCRRLEQTVAKQAAHVFALTPSDADDIRALGFSGPITQTPLIMNPQPRAAADSDLAGGVALLGNWNWSANRDGLFWFCEQVAPLLPPDVPIRVGGRGALDLPFSRIAGIGEVEDAGSFLGGAGVVAIPLISGTGVSMKVIEACANGWPCVTTPKGVRGLHHVPDNIVVAEEPEDFMHHLLAMLAVDATTRALWLSDGARWAAERNADFNVAISAGLTAALSAGRKA